MNRSRRRQFQRDVMRALRDNGCRCAPTIRRDQVATRGALNSGLVVHEAGCPLGAWVGTFNARGSTPELHFTASPGCRR